MGRHKAAAPGGASVKDIAEWVVTSQSTVYRYGALAEPPPRPAYRRKASELRPLEGERTGSLKPPRRVR